MPAVVKKRLQKIILWGIAACGVLLVALIGTMLWTGSTEPIESVAKTFKPGSGWERTQYKVEPPRFACLSGRCPEVAASWRVKGSINEDGLKRFLGDLSTIDIKSDSCLAGRIDDDRVTSCSLEGARGGYYVAVFVSKDREYQDGTFTRVGLSIRKDSL